MTFCWTENRRKHPQTFRSLLREHCKNEKIAFQPLSEGCVRSKKKDDLGFGHTPSTEHIWSTIFEQHGCNGFLYSVFAVTSRKNKGWSSFKLEINIKTNCGWKNINRKITCTLSELVNSRNHSVIEIKNYKSAFLSIISVQFCHRFQQ